jgi:hypothetical protein
MYAQKTIKHKLSREPKYEKCINLESNKKINKTLNNTMRKKKKTKINYSKKIWRKKSKKKK